MKNLVVLGLGSNTTFGNKSSIDLLHSASSALSAILTDMQQSSIYQTKPMYVEDQQDFFNMVVCGYYENDSYSLLSNIHKIEAQLGRNREQEIRFGPRSIDIDIEMFGEEKLTTDELTIPHPRLFERAFVLVPIVELICAGKIQLADENVFFDALNEIGADGVKLYNA